MYPEIMLIPMREELTKAGIQETRTAEEVEQALAKPGTTMVVVNSVCGCAAGKLRPGVRLALKHSTLPDHMITVFAGQDDEATSQVRSHLAGHPPSSPAIAIFQDSKLVFLLQRSMIEGAPAPQIAEYLTQAFDEICVKSSVSAN
ncbi:MAG: BrxA/BrxB family bacilliredoxin [Acidobacteriaceae bacterium]